MLTTTPPRQEGGPAIYAAYRYNLGSKKWWYFADANAAQLTEAQVRRVLDRVVLVLVDARDATDDAADQHFGGGDGRGRGGKKMGGFSCCSSPD
jgi:hypothetical protein